MILMSYAIFADIEDIPTAVYDGDHSAGDLGRYSLYACRYPLTEAIGLTVK